MIKSKSIIIFVLIIVSALSTSTSIADETSELNQELFNAAKNGDIDQVKQLVEKGADVNTCIDGAEGSGPIIKSASSGGEAFMLKSLLKKKDDDYTTEELTKCVSALMIASSKGHLGVVRYLVNNGADVDDDTTSSTALMIASIKGYLDIVKFLVEKGADVNAVNNISGTTALKSALAMGHWDIVRFLVEKGADVNFVANVGNATALMIASREGRLDIVKFLVDNGADVDAVSNFLGGTALMIALREGHLDIAKFLVEKGADVNAVANEISLKGVTPLFIASRGGHLNIVKFLVEKGADVNTVATNEDEETITALMIALREGHLDIVKFLIKNGADVNTSTTGDVGGITPLMFASLRGYFNIAKLLVDNGADVNVVSKTGETIKVYAIKSANKKVEEYFKKLLKYNPYTSKTYKSTFTYFTQAEGIAEINTKIPTVKGLLKKENNGINDIGNYLQTTEAPEKHLEITIDAEFDENKLVFSYGIAPQSEEINSQIPLYQQLFTEDAANTHAYLIFPKEWKLSESFQEIEAIKNSDGSHYSFMTCSPENSELSSLLRNYNALLEGSFWSTEISNSQLEKAVDTASEEDENETIEQLQEKYGNYKIYKIPFYIPEGITQAYLNIGRSTTIYFDKSSLTGNGKIFIEIPQITFRLNESEAAKKATLEGLAYELDLAEVKGDYKPEYRFVEESTGLKKKRIDLGDDITMEFVYIPAGEFMMGSPSNEGRRFHDESPQHRVKISKGFWMGVYEVTNEQYQQFVKESNYDGERESNANYLSFHAGLDYPVCTVSWDNARAFCEWLSVKEGKTYRLPTEAQWEYACRAGRTKELNIKDDGLFLNTSGGRAASMRHTHPAGQNKPNPFGLYDMYDNVREWCRDWYGSYSDTAEVDPEGPSSGDERVVRGDYSGEIISYRCAERSSNPPDKPSHEIGFRIVCDDSE